jgi:hypothetical protein
MSSPFEVPANVGIVKNVSIADHQQRSVFVADHTGARFAAGGSQKAQREHGRIACAHVHVELVRTAGLKYGGHAAQVLFNGRT